MIGNHQLDAFQTFISLGIALDREALAATIRMSDSDLGRGLSELIQKGAPEKIDFEQTIAMLKLTAFYLDELHKLFPTSGERK